MEDKLYQLGSGLQPIWSRVVKTDSRSQSGYEVWLWAGFGRIQILVQTSTILLPGRLFRDWSCLWLKLLANLSGGGHSVTIVHCTDATSGILHIPRIGIMYVAGAGSIFTNIMVKILQSSILISKMTTSSRYIQVLIAMFISSSCTNAPFSFTQTWPCQSKE